jgi:hypothetical protein
VGSTFYEKCGEPGSIQDGIRLLTGNIIYNLSRENNPQYFKIITFETYCYIVVMVL